MGGTMAAPSARPDRLLRHYTRSRSWCEWDAFDDWQPQLQQRLDEDDGRPISPFHLLSLPGMAAGQQQAGATRWMQQRLADSAGARAELSREFSRADALTAPRRADRPLRLGYLSSDFHQHATALLLAECLEAHDPQRFELHAYSHGEDDGRGMRQRLAAAFTGFHDIRALDDPQAARAIHGQGIDILIDLKGYTAGSRSLLMAYRAAPVQVSFLGYPGTLGPGLCDYLVSDRFITPASEQAHYSEALACLPHSYQPHGHAAALPAPWSRTAAGLPEQGRVLCCFNQAYKFTPEVFGIWCELLQAAPDAVLWLLHDERAEGNLRREALQRGVAPHRLVFAPDLPQPQHLARLPCADLVLDTLPYNAHTTASDALWAGVPLLTCAGSTFASRVAGSLLHAVGLPELVTHHLADYRRLALQLLAEPARLTELRQRLAGLRGSAALFNVPGYTRHLEALYEQMWQRHAAGLPPAALDVPPDP